MSDKISGGGGALREFNLGGNLNLLILISTQLIQNLIRGLTFYLHSLEDLTSANKKLNLGLNSKSKCYTRVAYICKLETKN